MDSKKKLICDGALGGNTLSTESLCIYSMVCRGSDLNR